MGRIEEHPTSWRRRNRDDRGRDGRRKIIPCRRHHGGACAAVQYPSDRAAISLRRCGVTERWGQIGDCVDPTAVLVMYSSRRTEDGRFAFVEHLALQVASVAAKVDRSRLSRSAAMVSCGAGRGRPHLGHPSLDISPVVIARLSGRLNTGSPAPNRCCWLLQAAVVVDASRRRREVKEWREPPATANAVFHAELAAIIRTDCASAGGAETHACVDKGKPATLLPTGQPLKRRSSASPGIAYILRSRFDQDEYGDGADISIEVEPGSRRQGVCEPEWYEVGRQ